ncbi:exonuclease SbcCD subunit D [soil metagenome]
MRFLHTGDWHVGRTIRGRSRLEEFATCLDAVVDVARDEGVDAVLLSGDIYDQHSVSPESDRMIFDTLLRFNALDVAVIAVPGNHDSAPRLEAFAPLLERVGTRVVVKPLRPAEGGIVTIGSRDGSETALVACVPFVSPRRFSSATEVFEDMATGYVNFDDNMGKLLAAYAREFRGDAVNIVLGHMFISGAQPGGSEREITIGSEFAVSPSRLPATAAYVALGHIHKAQRVEGASGQARYCGSLLQLDFGERGQDKSVVVVEVSASKPARTKEVPIDGGRRLLRLDATLDELDSLGQSVGDAYLRVDLALPGPVPGIADIVRAKLPNALDIRLVLPSGGDGAPSQSLRGLAPRDQFSSYYLSAHGTELPEHLSDAFDKVYEDVTA